MLTVSMPYHQLPITANFFFLILFLKIKTNEQHTATDLVNLVIIQPVSSDHTDFIRDLTR